MSQHRFNNVNEVFSGCFGFPDFIGNLFLETCYFGKLEFGVQANFDARYFAIFASVQKKM